MTASQLAALRSPSTAVHIDRDPALFEAVLAFLDTGALPENVDVLRRLYVEAAHYRLARLRDAIELKLLDSGFLGGAEDASAPVHHLAPAPAREGRAAPAGRPGSTSLLLPEQAPAHALRASMQAATLMSLVDLDLPAAVAPRAASAATSDAAGVGSSAEVAPPWDTAERCHSTASSPARTSEGVAGPPPARGQLAQPASPSAASATSWGAPAGGDADPLSASMLFGAPGGAAPAAAGPQARQHPPVDLNASVDMTEYLTGRWRDRYAAAADSGASSAAPQLMGVPEVAGLPAGWGAGRGGSATSGPSPARTSNQALSHRAAATALPDPFGFSRWRSGPSVASSGEGAQPAHLAAGAFPIVPAPAASTAAGGLSPLAMRVRGAVPDAVPSPRAGAHSPAAASAGREPEAVAVAAAAAASGTGTAPASDAAAAAAAAAAGADAASAAARDDTINHAVGSNGTTNADGAGASCSGAVVPGDGRKSTDEELEDVAAYLAAIRRNVALSLAKLHT
jgi:hypothetical protein